MLTDRHLAFLKEGRFFRNLGISFDVYGDQRVDTKGKLRTNTILDNMQKLIDHGVPFGAIAVLGRHTLSHAADIYRFYDQLGIQSRFLPFYMSASDEQISQHALNFVQITSALKAIFNEWMASDRATPVEPIDRHIDYAVSYLTGGPKAAYDKMANEFVYIVNLDGGTWGVSEAYDPVYRYGNVFEDQFVTILASPARQRAAAEAGQRMHAYCHTCPYFGHCPGHFVGNATPQERQLLAESGCPVREVIGYIVDNLDKSDIKDSLAVRRERQVYAGRLKDLPLQPAKGVKF